MRYSKKKKITIGVISVIIALFIGFIIYKGINDSMKISDNTEGTKSKLDSVASISKVFKKKKSKADKKEVKVIKKKNDDSDVKVVSKKEIEKNSKDTVDESIIGTYEVIELKVGDRKYKREELRNLKAGGYTLFLEINSDGTANLEVLYINKLFTYDNEKFTDGQNEYKYKRTRNKITIKIDDADITFRKE